METRPTREGTAALIRRFASAVHPTEKDPIQQVPGVLSVALRAGSGSVWRNLRMLCFLRSWHRSARGGRFRDGRHASGSFEQCPKTCELLFQEIHAFLHAFQSTVSHLFLGYHPAFHCASFFFSVLFHHLASLHGHEANDCGWQQRHEPVPGVPIPSQWSFHTSFGEDPCGFAPGDGFSLSDFLHRRPSTCLVRILSCESSTKHSSSSTPAHGASQSCVSRVVFDHLSGFIDDG